MNKTTLSLALLASTFVSSQALAHATLEVPEAAVNSYYKAVMRVPHGCDGQPTRKVRISIPEGIISVKPMPKAGWTLETVKGDYHHTYQLHGSDIASGVKEIIWSGTLADEHFDEFVFQARLTDELPVGGTVHIPTVQECADGEVAWVEIPAEGQDPHALKRPAPGLLVMASADGQGGHAAHTGNKEPVVVGDLTIEEMRIRAAPPNAPVSAGYMVITNKGAEADRLIGGSVEFAGRVEVHEMKMDGEVMKMREIQGGLEIPPGGTVELKPGGYHIMFMQMQQPVALGETHPVTLIFEKAGTVELDAPVVETRRRKGHDHK